MKVSISILLLMIAGLFSCKEDCNDYLKKVERIENGLLQEKEMGGVIYSLQYQPIDYILYKEFKTCDLNTDEIKKRKKELGDMDYFELKIKAKDNTDVLMKNLEDKEQYYDRLNYCSFDMQDDFIAVDNKDTSMSGLYHFQNNYGLHSHVSFLIAFEKSKQTHDVRRIIYKDFAFGNGNILFDFEKDQMEKYNDN